VIAFVGNEPVPVADYRLLERSNYSLCLCAFRIHSAAVYTRFLSVYNIDLYYNLYYNLYYR
jgi:hypothetical protein